MSYFVIDYKLRFEKKIIYKINILPTLFDEVWQSMESMAMFEFRLKSMNYMR
jgi:hypothetical protein